MSSCFTQCTQKLGICGGQGEARCGSLLDGLLGLLGFLRLLLGGGGSGLDGLDLLNKEGAGDALTDLGVSEDATVGARDSAARVAHAAQLFRAATFDASETGTIRFLGDVLNGELATGGLDGAELVRLGAVRCTPLVCDSSIQHFRSVYIK